MEYSSSGRFLNLDLIDNLGSTMLMTSELTFLGLFYSVSLTGSISCFNFSWKIMFDVFIKQ